MTSLERVLAALRGEAADRRAHTLTLSLYGARLSGCPMRDYFSDPRRYLEGQNEVVRRLDPDILFTPFALPLEALAYGGEAVWFDRFPPNLRKPPFRDANQVQPLGEGLLAAPMVAYLLDATVLMVQAHGREKPVCAVVTAPVDLPAMLLGIEGWLEILLFQPDWAEALLDLAQDHFLRLTAAFFAAGAAFVACPVMFANLRLVTPGLLEGRILPALARAFGQVQGPVVFHSRSSAPLCGFAQCGRVRARSPRQPRPGAGHAGAGTTHARQPERPGPVAHAVWRCVQSRE